MLTIQLVDGIGSLFYVMHKYDFKWINDLNMTVKYLYFWNKAHSNIFIALEVGGNFLNKKKALIIKNRTRFLNGATLKLRNFVHLDDKTNENISRHTDRRGAICSLCKKVVIINI